MYKLLKLYTEETILPFLQTCSIELFVLHNHHLHKRFPSQSIVSAVVSKIHPNQPDPTILHILLQVIEITCVCLESWCVSLTPSFLYFLQKPHSYTTTIVSAKCKWENMKQNQMNWMSKMTKCIEGEWYTVAI